MKWLEEFDLYLMSAVGVRRLSLAYIARTNEDTEYVDNPPTLLSGRSHCAEFGLVEKGLIQRLPHNHVLYDQDSGRLSKKLAIGLAHSAYMTVIARFRINRNGRGELLESKEMFSGKAIWEKII